MKKLTTILLVTLAFVGLTSPATSADSAPPEESAPEWRERWEEMVAELQLSEEQKAEIAPILRRQAEQLRALRDDTSMRRGAKARRLKAINDEASRQIRAQLDPQQQARYDELRANARRAMKERLKERKS
jgi:Spy/CpxP family protein refolding chaperone